VRERIALFLMALQLASIGSVLPLVFGITYAPGVSSGQFVKFGISESYISADPSMKAKPQFLADIDNTAFYRADVENVSGTSIRYRMTRAFTNGTADEVLNLIEDINTGGGNATSGGFHYLFIAAGLQAGFPVANNANAPIIDQTAAANYAEASRNVDVYIATGPINANSSLTINQYWDIASGVLTQLAFSATQKSGSSGQYSTTWSDLLIISETNTWSPSTFGLAQILFYGLLGAICLTAAIAAVIVATRKKKSEREPKILGPSQGSGPPNLSQMPVCRNCNGYNLPGTLTCRHCGAKLS